MISKITMERFLNSATTGLSALAIPALALPFQSRKKVISTLLKLSMFAIPAGIAILATQLGKTTKRREDRTPRRTRGKGRKIKPRHFMPNSIDIEASRLIREVGTVEDLTYIGNQLMQLIENEGVEFYPRGDDTRAHEVIRAGNALTKYEANCRILANKDSQEELERQVMIVATDDPGMNIDAKNLTLKDKVRIVEQAVRLALAPEALQIRNDFIYEHYNEIVGTIHVNKGKTYSLTQEWVSSTKQVVYDWFGWELSLPSRV